MTRSIFLFFLLSLSFFSHSQDIKVAYNELGKTENFIFSTNKNKDFEVLYFFSYSCPACYALHETVAGWKKANVDNSKNIEFRKVPVIFKDYWLFTSKAHFIANGLKLDIENEIYKHFHEEKNFIVNDKTLINFFVSKFNVKKSKIMAFLKSPSLQKATEQAMVIADKFEVMGTPSFIIIDKEKNVYQVNNSIVKSRVNLIYTLTYLVKPELRELLTGEKK